MPTALLERPPPATHEPDPSPERPVDAEPPAPASAGRPPRRGGGGDGGGGGREPRGRADQFPIIVAALITAGIGALFTFLGILTQIWANMIGSQLPGA